MLGTATALTLLACKKEKNGENIVVEEPVEQPADIFEFGFKLNDYFVLRDTIEPGDSFGSILARNNIDNTKVHEIAQITNESFDIRKLQVGKPYTLLCAKDGSQKPQCFIYQPNNVDYLVVNLEDSIHAYTQRKPIKVVERLASGTITSSLSEAVTGQGMDYMVANNLSEIYAWTIDFFKLQPGDKFKVVYEEKFIDDTIYAGMTNIKAAYFEHKGQPFYAFNYNIDSLGKSNDYYDEKANMLKRAFLKAPLQFSRISSRFSPRRFHPVQKIWKAHKGTDYAAPHGTPIMATANGTVTKSERNGGNGNYVKIKHNKIYETQYLHMSKRAVKVGQYVKQGDIIGYVGSTGLATGPHVCYRFWKNGVQVDPLRENLPNSEPIAPQHKDEYLQFIQPLKVKLDQILFEEEQHEFVTDLN